MWKDALTFDPERFLGEGNHVETEFSGKTSELLPSGSGRRMCMRIALGAFLV